MATLSKSKFHSDVINYFKELPFYNKPIKKPVKCLENIDPLVELPFYEQLSVIKTDQAFKGYAMSYKVEIIEKKVPIVQLEASKVSIKNLFIDLLNKLKGFKYQITAEVLLKKYKHNGEIDKDKSDYVCIKDFNRFMFHKTKNKNKKCFAKVIYSVLVVKMC